MLSCTTTSFKSALSVFRISFVSITRFFVKILIRMVVRCIFKIRLKSIRIKCFNFLMVVFICIFVVLRV